MILFRTALPKPPVFGLASSFGEPHHSDIANEYLYRRVDIEDVVSAHLLASERAASIDFRKYIISATTPFHPEDLVDLRVDAPRVLRARSK